LPSDAIFELKIYQNAFAARALPTTPHEGLTGYITPDPWWVAHFFFLRMRLRPIVGQPGSSSIVSRVELGQTTIQLRKRAGFDDVGHRLGLTTGAQISGSSLPPPNTPRPALGPAGLELSPFGPWPETSCAFLIYCIPTCTGLTSCSEPSTHLD